MGIGQALGLLDASHPLSLHEELAAAWMKAGTVPTVATAQAAGTSRTPTMAVPEPTTHGHRPHTCTVVARHSGGASMSDTLPPSTPGQPPRAGAARRGRARLGLVLGLFSRALVIRAGEAFVRPRLVAGRLVRWAHRSPTGIVAVHRYPAGIVAARLTWPPASPGGPAGGPR